MTSTTSWISNYQTKEGSSIRLFCFHHSGGGAVFYREWNKLLPQDVEVVPVQLPGRWERFSEAPMKDMKVLIPQLYEGLKAFLDKPYAILGNSLGALVAYELARELRRRKAATPLGLFMVARTAPHSPLGRNAFYTLPDMDLLQRMNELYGGVPDSLFTDPDQREIWLPLMRADLQLYETYQYQPEEPFSFPIHVFFGNADPTIKNCTVESWALHSSDEISINGLEGGHFFIETSKAQFFSLLSEKLSDLRPGFELSF